MSAPSRAVYEDGAWSIELNPAVVARFKRVFDGVAKFGSKVRLSDSPKNAKDLLWFADRHPIEFDPHIRVVAQAALEDEREENVQRILDVDYKPADVSLALPLRDYQARAVDLCLANGALLVGDDVGCGKSQPLDAKILTPTGWRLMGDLAVGDPVIGTTGAVHRVTGVYDRGELDVFRIITEDGRVTRACDEHLWRGIVGGLGEEALLQTKDMRALLSGDRPLRVPVYTGRMWKGRAIEWFYVSAIVADGRARCRCIAVDAPDHLYITDDFIVTHNTAIAIGLFARAIALPAVVVTLTSLPIQWEREVHRFAPELRTHIVKTSKPYPLNKNYRTGKPLPYPDVLILSYSKLTTRTGDRSWAEVIADANLCRTLIFDEGQMLRNNDSDRYRAAKVLRDAATYVCLTTATPVYNYGGEIHNVVEIVQPGTLGTKAEFQREWCGRGGESSESIEREGTGDMRKVRVEDPVALGLHLRDVGVYLRRTRADIGRELPGLQRSFHHVATDDSLRKIEDDLERLCKTLLYAGNREEKFKAGGELDWKLRLHTGLAKVNEVAGFARLMVEEGQKVLLYAWHHQVYDELRRMLCDKEVGNLDPAFYTGKESPQRKDLERARFMGGEDLERAKKYDHTLTETNILIMSLRAGAGLDGLQKVCSNVIFGELDWSPGVLEQAEGRVYRDGQPVPVLAYYLVSDEGSDPVVLDALNLKTEQSEGIRNLTVDVAKLKGADPDHMKKLAESYLKRRGKL